MISCWGKGKIKTHPVNQKCKDCERKQQFLKRAKDKYGDKYDYSKVIYKRNDIHIIIICPIHGEFKQTPKAHFINNGCQKCGQINRTKSNTFTTEQFIQKAVRIHGDKFNYTKTIYQGSEKEIVIICPTHGEFKQKAVEHYIRGCTKCNMENRKKRKPFDDWRQFSNEYDTKYFINKSKSLYGDKFNYSITEYKGSRKNLKYICKKHGVITQTPERHYSEGCLQCGLEESDKKRRIYYQRKFIEEATEIHKNKYDYSKVQYVKSDQKIIIICHKHGEFDQTPSLHLCCRGCPQCGHDRRLQLVLNRYSKTCIKWLKFMEVRYDTKIQHTENGGEYPIKNTFYFADGYCKKSNTVFEFMGDFWHGNPVKYKPEDINPMNNKKYGKLYENTIKRRDIIISKGYNYVEIWESEWNQIIKSVKKIQRWYRKNRK